MKRLAGAAVLLARRDPRLAALTEEEFHALEGILRRLRIASPDSPQNQTESSTAMGAELVSEAKASIPIPQTHG